MTPNQLLPEEIKERIADQIGMCKNISHFVAQEIVHFVIQELLNYYEQTQTPAITRTSESESRSETKPWDLDLYIE